MLTRVLIGAIQVYTFVMVAWVVASWVPQLRGNRAMQWVGRLCEPVLRPIRRVLPTMGGIDLSPLVAILALQFLARLILRAAY
jgi:YggT family protein